MIRPFDWRDFGLVRRLSEHGVCFDAEAALTRGTHTLQSAVLAFLAPGMSVPTFVWRGANSNGDAAFAQFRYRSGDEHARLTFLAPGYSDGGPWESLLECVTHEAAARGAHNLVAEVDEHSAEFEALRRFGFAIYARQDIWRLAQPQPPASAAATQLRPQQSSDSFGVQTLYSNIVPRLVQQVEAPPSRHGHGYVLEENGEYVAYFDVSRGPLGIWIQPYLHPSIFDYSVALLTDLLRCLAERERQPIYMCVRAYQDWLRSPLADLGFEAWGEQAVMVKRLAVRVGEPEFKPLPVIAGSKVTPQLIRSHSQCSASSRGPVFTAESATFAEKTPENGVCKKELPTICTTC